jgi:hypothetical protein
MVLAILVSVEVAAHHPVALDPLIAEAKQRMRRRRILLIGLIGALILAAGAMVTLRPFGSTPAGRSVRSADGPRQLAHLKVPVNAYERQWRRWIRHYVSRSDEIRTVAEVQRALRASVAASGAEILRLNVWPTTAPPSVELVVTTSISPAVYLKHDLAPLLGAIHGEWRYVEVVDKHGTVIFQNGYRRRAGHFEGMVGVPPRLGGCSPVANWGDTPPPCPVK